MACKSSSEKKREESLIGDQACFSKMAREVAMNLQAWFFEVAVG